MKWSFKNSSNSRFAVYLGHGAADSGAVAGESFAEVSPGISNSGREPPSGGQARLRRSSSSEQHGTAPPSLPTLLLFLRRTNLFLQPLFTHQLPTSSVALPSLSVPPLPSLHGAVSTIPLPPVPLLSSTSQLPIMQLCQLQAAIQQQVSCHSSLGRTVRSRFGSCSKPSTDGEIEVIRAE